MKEIFKDVQGYEGLYQISNLGRVKSLKRRVRIGSYERTVPEKYLTHFDVLGYDIVVLHKKSKKYTAGVHRLIALHFIDNPENKPQVNHKDGNKKNNSIENLEWATSQENIQHSHDTGLTHTPRGSAHYRAQFHEHTIMKIRALAKHLSQRVLANIFNCCQADISNIVNYKRWAHVP